MGNATLAMNPFDSSSPCRIVPFLLAGAAILAAGPIRAQEVPGYPPLNPHTLLNGPYDPRELALLPKYCYTTQIFREFAPGGRDKAEMDRWYALLGGTYHHLHHYCWGMMKSNRANLLARDHRVRQFFLNDALAEYDYVIERAPADFVLLPEILAKKADNLFQLNRAPVAIFQLERAIELKPDYWPPYAKLADYYKGVGQVQKAREILVVGLKAAPDAVGLKRRLSELEAAGNGKK